MTRRDATFLTLPVCTERKPLLSLCKRYRMVSVWQPAHSERNSAASKTVVGSVASVVVAITRGKTPRTFVFAARHTRACWPTINRDNTRATRDRYRISIAASQHSFDFQARFLQPDRVALLRDKPIFLDRSFDPRKKLPGKRTWTFHFPENENSMDLDSLGKF